MKKIIPLVFVGTMALSGQVSAQDAREANFQFKQENYQVALNLYNNVYKKDTNNIDCNYAIGVSRIKTNSAPASALKHLLKAEEKYGGDVEFLEAMTLAYLHNHNFVKAREYYNKLLAKVKDDPNTKVLAKHIDNAEKMVKTPLDVTFVNLGKAINSNLDETTPMLTSDGEFLFYTSNRKYDTSIKMYTSDIYFSNSNVGDFKKSRVASAINTMDDDFLAGLSVGSNEVFYRMDGFDAFEDLLAAEIVSGAPKGKNLLPQTINSKSVEQGAYMFGDTLFFSSDKPGGYGGLDIYYSIRLPNGDWSEAVNLGKEINSEYDESFPMFSADGSKFYFCSNGVKSMGGYDVFECTFNVKTRTFGTPKNIGYPLNDTYNNKTISYTPDGNYAYVSAIKPDSYGGADIYRVVFNDKDPMVKMYLVKLVTEQGDQKIPFGDAGKGLKISVFKNKTLFGTYVYNAATSVVGVALLPGNYVLEIEGENIEPFSMKLNVSNAPGNKIEKINATLKPKK